MKLMASALRKNYRRYFFMWCEVSLWNSLPQQVRQSNTADTLKNGLDNFMANNNICSYSCWIQWE